MHTCMSVCFVHPLRCNYVSKVSPSHHWVVAHCQATGHVANYNTGIGKLLLCIKSTVNSNMLQWRVHSYSPFRHLFYLQSSQPIKMHTISSIHRRITNEKWPASEVCLVVQLHLCNENTLSHCSFTIISCTCFLLDTCDYVLTATSLFCELIA